MAKLLVLYKRPTDEEAFNRYYFQHHVPLAKQIPGLLSYEISDGAVMAPNGPSDVHLVASLDFATQSDVIEGLRSEAGQRAAADLANFASAGVELMFFDTQAL